MGYIKKEKADFDFTKARILRGIHNRTSSTASNDVSPMWKAPV
jgi:hypothetical protein